MISPRTASLVFHYHIETRRYYETGGDRLGHWATHISVENGTEMGPNPRQKMSVSPRPLDRGSVSRRLYVRELELPTQSQWIDDGRHRAAAWFPPADAPKGVRRFLGRQSKDRPAKHRAWDARYWRRRQRLRKEHPSCASIGLALRASLPAAAGSTSQSQSPRRRPNRAPGSSRGEGAPCAIRSKCCYAAVETPFVARCGCALH